MAESREDDAPPATREEPVMASGEGWSDGDVVPRERDLTDPASVSDASGSHAVVESPSRRPHWEELDPVWTGRDVNGASGPVEADARGAIDAASKDVGIPRDQDQASGLEIPIVDEPAPERDGGGPEREHAPIADAIVLSDAHKALNLDEARSYAENDVGIEYADFSGFDQATANETNATLEALRDRYPSVPGLRSVSTIQTRDAEVREGGLLEPPPVDQQTIAETAPQTWGAYSGVALNESWASDYAGATQDLEDQVANGGHPIGTGSIAGVITHEFGHLLANDLRVNHAVVYEKAVAPVLNDLSSNESTEIKTEVSGYAAKSSDELVAEAFSEYQLSPSPRRCALLLGEAMDTAYRRVYGD
jgi:hypothetical protein